VNREKSSMSTSPSRSRSPARSGPSFAKQTVLTLLFPKPMFNEYS
jgi:hypothetical protein